MVLERDGNTAFFHLMANGRRKKSILNIEHEEENIHDQNQIKGVINSYYKTLFGNQPVITMKLGEEVWAQKGRLSTADNEQLL